MNAEVRGHTFTNNMDIFLEHTQLHWIQWISLINPIISLEWGFWCPLVPSFLTGIFISVPAPYQPANLGARSPSQGDCYDHVVHVPTSGCGWEIGSVNTRAPTHAYNPYTHTHTGTHAHSHARAHTHTHAHKGWAQSSCHKNGDNLCSASLSSWLDRG